MSIEIMIELSEHEAAMQDEYLRGLLKGEDNIEKQRFEENKLWQEVTTNLRKLAVGYGATQAEINRCWRV